MHDYNILKGKEFLSCENAPLFVPQTPNAVRDKSNRILQDILKEAWKSSVLLHMLLAALFCADAISSLFM
jgi:hypothetical protein